MKQTEASKRWELQPYQDALRPLRGQQVEFAVIATYSLDLPSLVSALLALSGQDDDKGSGSPVGLVTAVKNLKGRVRVLHQKGLLKRPTKVPRITPLLDQFRLEVSPESLHCSWHPKAFLIKLSENNQTHWRFWMGSKNLTHDASWDFGLLLLSHPLNKGSHIPGLIDAAMDMVSRSTLPSVSMNILKRQLDEITWQIPSGVKIKELRWLTSSARPYPEVPHNASKVYVVSPFLDRKTLEHFGSRGQQRLLLSLDCELSRLATEAPNALAAYATGLHGMAKPSPEVGVTDANTDELDAPDSLHAKLFYVETGRDRTLWVGSANATSRGLRGPNIEVMARLDLSRELVLALENFIRRQRLLDLKTIPKTVEDKSEIVRRKLEAFRNEFLFKYRLVQVRTAEALEIVITPRLEIPAGFVVRMATLLGDLKNCPSGTNSLPVPQVGLHELSDLVQVQIELEEETLAWLQTATLSPRIDEKRDNAVIRKNLTLQERLEFLRLLLDGVPVVEGRAWDDDTTRSGRVDASLVLTTPLPTLEQILKADPSQLSSFSKSFRAYFEEQEWSRSELNSRDLRLLREFESMWKTAQAVLVMEETD